MRRRIEFAVGECYHIFNRGVEKRNIFIHERDYHRFTDSMVFFNTEKPGWVINNMRAAGIDARPQPEDRLVDIISYCINSNHFHLLLREKKQNGIATFMKKICTGYAMYFNKKHNHSGVVFQGRFKSVHIKSNEQLLYVSAYINCNCEIHGFSKAETYRWSSLGEFIGNREDKIAEKEMILGQFKDGVEYREYAMRQIPEIRLKKENENLFLE